jgi:hypothetical protein
MVSGQLHSRERVLGAYCNGGRVGPRADLDSRRRGKFDAPAVHRLARRCTD